MGSVLSVMAVTASTNTPAALDGAAVRVSVDVQPIRGGRWRERRGDAAGQAVDAQVHRSAVEAAARGERDGGRCLMTGPDRGRGRAEFHRVVGRRGGHAGCGVCGRGRHDGRGGHRRGEEQTEETASVLHGSRFLSGIDRGLACRRPRPWCCGLWPTVLERDWRGTGTPAATTAAAGKLIRLRRRFACVPPATQQLRGIRCWLGAPRS
jgi:hypothetical protein